MADTVYLEPLKEGFIGPPTKPWYKDRTHWNFKCHFPDGSARSIPFECTYPNGAWGRHKWVPKPMESFIFRENGIGEWFAFPEIHADEIDHWGMFTKLLVRYFS